MTSSSLLRFGLLLLVPLHSWGLATPKSSCKPPEEHFDSTCNTHSENFKSNSGLTLQCRRNLFSSSFSTLLLGTVFSPLPSRAGTFTPGGTLVDRDVGITVGNAEASPTRKVDNSNVLFTQDNYFKFGVAAPWIEPDSTDFPKTMPFVLTQQRYDTLKKYGDRVKKGIYVIQGLDDAINSEEYSNIANADDPKYALRPLGLLANGFLGSDNTGTTNELLLARWYINEIYLRIGDIRNASTKEDAMSAFKAAKNSVNSYLAMMNRVISEKVGTKFEYI